jgi:hypothetical protein
MSDLYEIKARKYKLKYLKLKQEYIGEGGVYEQPPPIRFKQIYPTYTKINLNKLYTNKYIGKIYSDENGIDELNKKKNIQKYDKRHDYTSEIVYVGKIQENLSGNVYIVRKTIGNSFEHLQMINNNNIKQILQSLKDGIINFITKIYDDGYVLCIDKEKMSLKDNKIYYNYDNMYEYDRIHEIKSHVTEEYYPYILKHFDEIIEKKVTKKQLIDLLLSKHEKHLVQYINEMTNIKYTFAPLDSINEKVILYYDEFSLIYNNKNNEYKKNVSRVFSSLNENDDEHDINQIYETYISPIAKNSDIYALCNLIWDIYVNQNSSLNQLNNKTLHLIIDLKSDALYNLIDGPRDLSTKLDKIIKSLKDK